MLLLKNGLVLSMARPAFTGDVLIRDGRIAAAGEHLSEDGAEVVDCTGRYVLPGFVDAHCHIGMWEDGMGEEGADGNENSDPITPQMRAIDGLNPFDPCFKEARAAGVTTVVTGPGSANVIGGQFAALKTYGRYIEEMVIQDPVAMKAAFGENPKRVYTEQKEAPYTRMAIASLFRGAMVEAQEYERKLKLGEEDADKLPDRDLGLEALLPVLHGEIKLKMHAHRADDILTALRLAKEFNLSVTLDHCTEGHLILDVLKEQTEALGAGVILGPLFSDRSKIELRNMTFRAPKLMHEAGIPFALMTDHPVIPIQHLPVCAALCVREGLDADEALRAITINAAKITGIEKRVGSLEAGKDADIAIFDGPPLDVRSHCLRTIINGNTVHLLDA
ncbi:MAG TPA: amidohydrolase [Feifaniaceae bacterium]|nr:amidohydrolase [Feifaniaceae bacterium]